VGRRLNIVIATDTCEIDGGAALVALGDAVALAREGHRVIFFSACGRPPDESNGIEWISLGQQNILNEPNRLKAILNGLWNLSAAQSFAHLLGRLPRESTIVHVHSWSKALSGSVISVAHRRGFKLVCTLHDYFTVCPNGGLYDYPARHVCSRQPMSMNCISTNCDSRAYAHKLWRVLRQWIWRHLSGIPDKFDAMLAVSDFSANIISKLLGGRKIDVVNNISALSQAPLRPRDERAAIAYAGRVAAEKGVDVYLEASRIANLQAQVWGDGPMLPELRRAWPEAHFSGWLPKAELTGKLQGLIALVVPSLWYENSPMVIAEAAAAGVPVIVSDNGAPATLVEDGVTGLHFRAGDAADLAKKISVLCNDPQFAYSMGQAAYNRFWLDYDNRRRHRIEQLEACYQTLLFTTT
jgi:glycosyltransferase involved in cell wall biosynthesis